MKRKDWVYNINTNDYWFQTDYLPFQLDIDGSKTKAIMQDIQFHPVTDKILHIDFLELFDLKPITVSLPVILEGVAIGVKNGGNLMFRRPKIITKGLVADLPDAITINIEDLKIGMFIYIKDINIEGAEFLAPLNSVVVGVKTARSAIEEVSEDLDEDDAEDKEVDDSVKSENAESVSAE